ncbi:MAG: hypothetical protein ACI35O_04405 [Bacillaceae bacterium]
MKTKHYIGFILLLFFSIFIAVMTANYIFQIFDKTLSETYKHSPIILLKDVLFIPVGVILGLPAFYYKKKQQGKWRFNLLHFLILGVPSLLLMLYLMFYLFMPPYFNVLPSNISFAMLEIAPYPVFAVLFGYAIISNWNKVN